MPPARFRARRPNRRRRSKRRSAKTRGAAADGAEARTEVTFRLSCSASQQLQTLSGGTLELCTERDPERPSVVLRAPRGRESVWEIAKQYGTTVQAVKEANHLDSELVEEGQLLLIPM